MFDIECNSKFLNTSRLNFIYISSDNKIATVSSYGTVTALKIGEVTITAVPKFGYGEIANFSFNFEIINSGSGQVVLTTDKNDPNGSSPNGTQLSIGGLPGGSDLRIEYTRSMCIVLGPSSLRQDYYWVSSDSSVASINEFGYVEGKSRGIVTITAISKYNPNWIGIFTIYVE